MIEIRGVKFRYPRQQEFALGGIDLNVRRGSLFGLLGPNGSGKTTLISILTGLLRAASGTVRVDGKDLSTHIAEIQAFSSLVPQENAFYPSLTVAENLDFFSRIQAIPANERAARVSEVIAIADLETALATQAAKLSGGMKRRLSIALGLLNRPRLLFLDEPTVGIDPQSRQFLLDAIKQINAAGTTIVYSSHYMDEVEYLCDEVGILDNGTLVTSGSMSQLLAAARVQRLRIDTTAALTEAQRNVIGQFAEARVNGTRIEIDACSNTTVEKVLSLLATQHVDVAAIQYGAADLQEVFFSHTKTALRDG